MDYFDICEIFQIFFKKNDESEKNAKNELTVNGYFDYRETASRV